MLNTILPQFASFFHIVQASAAEDTWSTENSSRDHNEHKRVLEQCKKLEGTNQRLRTKKTAMGHHIDEFMAVGKKRGEELDQIKGQLQKEKNATGRLITELNNERARRTELEQRLNELRQMLVHTPDNNISDSAIIHQYLRLRSRIPGLVKQTWKVELKEGAKFDELSATRGGFFDGLYAGNGGYWKHCPHELLGLAVFALLNETVFSCRPYFLHPDHKCLEEALGDVEGAMWKFCPSEGMQFFLRPPLYCY